MIFFRVVGHKQRKRKLVWHWGSEPGMGGFSVFCFMFSDFLAIFGKLFLFSEKIAQKLVKKDNSTEILQ